MVTGSLPSAPSFPQGHIPLVGAYFTPRETLHDRAQFTMTVTSRKATPAPHQHGVLVTGYSEGESSGDLGLEWIDGAERHVHPHANLLWGC